MATITFCLPHHLSSLAGGDAAMRLQAATPREALDLMALRAPALHRSIRDDNGRLKGYIRVAVNGSDARSLPLGLDTGLQDGDRVSLAAAIAGG